MLTAPNFSIKLYTTMQGEHPTVRWKGILCNNKASLKALFLTWFTLEFRGGSLLRLDCGNGEGA